MTIGLINPGWCNSGAFPRVLTITYQWRGTTLAEASVAGLVMPGPVARWLGAGGATVTA